MHRSTKKEIEKEKNHKFSEILLHSRTRKKELKVFICVCFCLLRFLRTFCERNYLHKRNSEPQLSYLKLIKRNCRRLHRRLLLESDTQLSYARRDKVGKFIAKFPSQEVLQSNKLSSP